MDTFPCLSLFLFSRLFHLPFPPSSILNGRLSRKRLYSTYWEDRREEERLLPSESSSTIHHISQFFSQFDSRWFYNTIPSFLLFILFIFILSPSSFSSPLHCILWKWKRRGIWDSWQLLRYAISLTLPLPPLSFLLFLPFSFSFFTVLLYAYPSTV